MKTLKVLSALLTYPTAELIGAAGQLKDVLRKEALLPKSVLAELEGLIDEIGQGDLMDLQERYIMLFDRTRSLSLQLFEHVHGESRDRGQAMVNLLKQYEDAGFAVTAEELPDFLPLFLEFASTREPLDAIELIGQPAHVVAALRERLAKRRTAYVAVFDALTALSKAKPDAAALEALRQEPDPEPDDLEALDAAWEDEAVTFGPTADSCGHDGLVSKLRHATRAVPGTGRPASTEPRVAFTHSNTTAAKGAPHA
jgi:nitrate reductase molybdenum cofactor assembly chaperone NarJ/NarW